MGTNVIGPLLIEIRHPDEPAWLVGVKGFVNKQPWLNIKLRDARSRREQATLAFFDLGPAGITAIPELARLLTNYSSAVVAAHALAGMGTNAIPAFETALTNANTWVNDCGVWGLAQFGTNSRVAVPLILPLFKTGNSADNMLVIWALGEIREPVEIICPEFLSHLHHAEPQVRKFAAEALAKLGPDAKPGWPEIKIALDNETDPDARAALAKLAKQVNSDADFSPLSPK
jgi:HEAT repeat protein